jgi:hypothetical protein
VIAAALGCGRFAKLEGLIREPGRLVDRDPDPEADANHEQRAYGNPSA